MKFSNYEVNVYMFAIRYAQHRETGAALMVVKTILANWDKFTVQDKIDLRLEAEDYTACSDDWERLINKELGE